MQCTSFIGCSLGMDYVNLLLCFECFTVEVINWCSSFMYCPEPAALALASVSLIILLESHIHAFV